MPKVYHLDAAGRERVLDQLSRALRGRPALVFAYVHGSFLSEVGFRDIDVAVWTDSAVNSRLDLELGAELSATVGYPVDVRMVNGAPVAFLFSVFRGRPLLVRDERLVADLIERTARTYHDLAPLTRRAVREAFTA